MIGRQVIALFVAICWASEIFQMNVVAHRDSYGDERQIAYQVYPYGDETTYPRDAIPIYGMGPTDTKHPGFEVSIVPQSPDLRRSSKDGSSGKRKAAKGERSKGDRVEILPSGAQPYQQEQGYQGYLNKRQLLKGYLTRQKQLQLQNKEIRDIQDMENVLDVQIRSIDDWVRLRRADIGERAGGAKQKLKDLHEYVKSKEQYLAEKKERLKQEDYRNIEREDRQYQKTLDRENARRARDFERENNKRAELIASSNELLDDSEARSRERVAQLLESLSSNGSSKSKSKPKSVGEVNSHGYVKSSSSTGSTSTSKSRADSKVRSSAKELKTRTQTEQGVLK